MQLKRLNKAMIGGLVAMTAATGLIASTMTAASADPTRPYAATGSDTIQDVWNGLTNDFGAVAPSIASWNAFVDPPSTVAAGTYNSYIQTKTGGKWFFRPSGSGNGRISLSAVWDSTYTSHLWPSAAPNVALTHEDIDFARSSSGPSAGNGLKFLPFARDAVAIAYHPYSTLGAGLNLTTGQITELYSGVDNAADGVVTFSAQPATSTTTVSINGVVVHPQIPQGGSGTRGFFLGAIGVTGTGNPALAPYIADPASLAAGAKPENDGTQIPNNGDLIPFSAAQWIAQNNGKAIDTTTGLNLSSINNLAPTTGSAPSMSAGPLFGTKSQLSGDYTQVPGTGVGTFNRDTYDVVPTLFLAGTSKQQALVSILNDVTSGAGGKDVIRSFGFGTLQYAGNSANFLDGAFQH